MVNEVCGTRPPEVCDMQINCSEWVSVKDRLPEPYSFGLIYTEYGQYAVGELQEFGENVWFDAEYCSYHPTHWMPLPEPPKEDE